MTIGVRIVFFYDYKVRAILFYIGVKMALQMGQDSTIWCTYCYM